MHRKFAYIRHSHWILVKYNAVWCYWEYRFLLHCICCVRRISYLSLKIVCDISLQNKMLNWFLWGGISSRLTFRISVFIPGHYANESIVILWCIDFVIHLTYCSEDSIIGHIRGLSMYRTSPVIDDLYLSSSRHSSYIVNLLRIGLYPR